MLNVFLRSPVFFRIYLFIEFEGVGSRIGKRLCDFSCFSFFLRPRENATMSASYKREAHDEVPEQSESLPNTNSERMQNEGEKGGMVARFRLIFSRQL